MRPIAGGRCELRTRTACRSRSLLSVWSKWLRSVCVTQGESIVDQSAIPSVRSLSSTSDVSAAGRCSSDPNESAENRVLEVWSKNAVVSGASNEGGRIACSVRSLSSTVVPGLTQ